MKTPIAVLYVEDEAVDRQALVRLVRDQALPYRLTLAETLAAARAHLAQTRFDVIVADYHLPDGQCTELFAEVSDIPFVLLTGTLEEHLALRTLERGADDYLPKSPDQRHLEALPFAIEKTLYRKQLREKELRLVEELRTSQEQLRQAKEALADTNAHLQHLVRQRTAELEALNRRLHQDLTERRVLEREILNAVDRERQRLGRELHDGLCALLTGIKFRVSLLERQRAKGQDIAPNEIRAVEEELNRAMEQARAMAHGLNPVQLVGRGLVTALEELAAGVQSVFGISCLCECPNPVSLSDPDTAQHLYRMAQEALHNAARHGRARNIRLGLKDLQHSLLLSVQDDGVGFPAEAPPAGGTGLRNMQARAELIGAKFEIASAPQGGTLITCTVPRAGVES